MCRSAHDLVGAAAIGEQKDDLGSPDMFLRTVAVPRHSLQTASNGGRDSEDYSGAHAHDSHAPIQTGIPTNHAPRPDWDGRDAPT
jgi:hypothetical protein